MSSPTVTEHTDSRTGLHFLDVHVSGSLRLCDTRVYEWLVLSRVVVPQLPAAPEYRAEATARLARALSRDKHLAITSARMQGGPECNETIAAIKEALRAKL